MALNAGSSVYIRQIAGAGVIHRMANAAGDGFNIVACRRAVVAETAGSVSFRFMEIIVHMAVYADINMGGGCVRVGRCPP